MGEFETIKHSLPWKGSYQRKLVISPTEIITKDPNSGSVTNRWPKDSLRAAKAVDSSDESAAQFVLKMLGGGPFCGLGETALTSRRRTRRRARSSSRSSTRSRTRR